MTDSKLTPRTADMLQVRSIDVDRRTVDVICSTEAIDSYGEIVSQDSWRLERFLTNPVVLFGHNSRELPIGTASNVEVRDGKLQATITFASSAVNPFAEQVLHAFEERVLRAVSVGFNPGSYRYEKRDGRDVCVLSDCELFELSVVPLPANPEALAKMKSAIVNAPRSPLSLGDAILVIGKSNDDVYCGWTSRSSYVGHPPPRYSTGPDDLARAALATAQSIVEDGRE